ncbi:hypothetical protein BGZ68_009207 [Mortierella alpina]|nr:hypothetical protein BGZ68_009207 [Mortierella alpina]
MKAIASTLCVLAAACLIAHVGAQQDPKDNQQNYFATALQRDEPDDTVSELDYRSSILAQTDQPEFQADGFFDFLFPAPTVSTSTALPISIPSGLPIPTLPPVISKPNCTDIAGILTGLVPGLDSVTSNATAIPILGTISTEIKGKLTELASNILGIVAAPLTTAINAIKSALQAIANIPIIGPIVKPIISIIDTILKVLSTLKGCGPSIPLPLPLPSGESKAEVEPEAQCSAIADLYRTLIKDSIKQSPAVPESATEDLKRVTAGSLSLLSLMDSSSIASTNDAILATRPIFSGDLLDQYRREMVHLSSENDDLQKFAQTNLALIVSMSNALEACLHVAVDPVGAAEDLAEEYDAMAEEAEEDEDA